MIKKLNIIFDLISHFKNAILLLFGLLIVSVLAKSLFLAIAIIVIYIGAGLMIVLQLCILYRKIDSKMIELIVEEQQHPIATAKNVTITSHFIIKEGFFPAIIEVKDIILVYRKLVLSWNRWAFDSILVLVTKQKKKYKFFLDSSALPILDDTPYFESLLKEMNSKILIGYSIENISLIRKEYGFTIKK